MGRMLLQLALSAVPAGLFSTASASPAVVPAAAPTGGPKPWVNSTEGIHLFLTFDYDLNQSQIKQVGKRYDYVWGSSQVSLTVSLCLSLYLCVSLCLSLPLAVSRCLSLSLAVSLCRYD